MHENQINKIEETLKFEIKMQGTKSDKNGEQTKTNEKQNSNVRSAYISTLYTLKLHYEHSDTMNNTSVHKSSTQLLTK